MFDAGPVTARRAFVDLHCHTNASFDSLSNPARVARIAAARGLTHLAITDHDRIDGALRARDAAPTGLTILVGEEIRTREGDLIGLFLDEPVPPGLSAAEAILAVRGQGGLVGIPHPFDRFRGSLLRDETMIAVAAEADWIEGHNARLIGSGNERAAALARELARPAVAVSDAHTLIEVGTASTALDGDPSTPAGLLAALAGRIDLQPGRGSILLRAVTPMAKLIQLVRGNGRIRPVDHPVAR
ncbi:MAG: PHP-associated domain-containing protein [Chloroflexota bacterium]